MKVVTKVDAIHATQRVLASEDGQVLMAYLVSKFGFLRRSTVGATPHETYLNEGQRTVLMEVGNLQDADPVKVKELEDLNGETDG